MKKFYALILIVSFWCAPLTYVHASSIPLESQLTALQAYVKRMTNSLDGAPLTDDELRESIRTGAAWLEHAQEHNGHFQYEYRPFENTYSEDDNIVRQTGALFALTELLRRDSDDPLTLEPAALRSIEYFASLSKEGTWNGKKFRCITKRETSKTCELGATALALTALIAYREHDARGARTYRALIDDYRSFILAMQKENGGFQNTFVIGRSSQSEKESPYSNGEALLALARLERSTPSKEVKHAIEDALAHLTTLPYDTALYLWIMAAMKELRAIDPNIENIDYVKDFTMWRITNGNRNRVSNKNFCAYTEGVVSALSILKGHIDEPAYANILNEANAGIRMNSMLQLDERDQTRALMGMDGLTFRTLPEPARATGGFLTSESEPTLRIDYTQHCVSAMTQMLTDVRVGTLIP